jgi:hypothetical protein
MKSPTRIPGRESDGIEMPVFAAPTLSIVRPPEALASMSPAGTVDCVTTMPTT